MVLLLNSISVDELCNFWTRKFIFGSSEEFFACQYRRQKPVAEINQNQLNSTFLLSLHETHTQKTSNIVQINFNIKGIKILFTNISIKLHTKYQLNLMSTNDSIGSIPVTRIFCDENQQKFSFKNLFLIPVI